MLTSSPLITRHPPATASRQYNTPDSPPDGPPSPPATVHKVHHAESKQRRRLVNHMTSRDYQESKKGYLSPAAQRRFWRSAGPAARFRLPITSSTVQTNPSLEMPPSSTTSIGPSLDAAPIACYKIVLTPPPSSDELPMPILIKLVIDTPSPRKISPVSPTTPSPLKGPSLCRKRRREEGRYPALLFMR
jgi:hypothetical protein